MLDFTSPNLGGGPIMLDVLRNLAHAELVIVDLGGDYRFERLSSGLTRKLLAFHSGPPQKPGCPNRAVVLEVIIDLQELSTIPKSPFREFMLARDPRKGLEIQGSLLTSARYASPTNLQENRGGDL